jgi:RNA polymerase sigma-70 factor (ECF subfamily)
VARITGKTEVNCRQIFARARQRIAAGGQARGRAQAIGRRWPGGSASCGCSSAGSAGP